MNIIAGILSGIAGAMGLGGGSFLLLYLTLIKDCPQLKAQGINLIFFIPCAIISIFLNARNKLIKWNVVIWVALGGVVGVGCGILVLAYIKPDMLSKIFGTFLIIFGIIEIFFKDKQKDTKKEKSSN